MAGHAAAALAFTALADGQRRSILERLARRPQAVVELARGLDTISRPAVSQHLKVLKDAGLVTARQDGTRRIYTLDPRGAHAMRAYLDKFWDDALLAFKAAAEADERAAAAADDDDDTTDHERAPARAHKKEPKR